MSSLTFENDLYLIETLERVLDKGVGIDAWVRTGVGGIELIDCRVRVVTPGDHDDDGGPGSGPAQQMRLRCG